MTRIYLDVDGVLANFVGATAELFGFDPSVVDCWDYYPRINMTERSFWDGVKDAGSDFWKTIRPGYPASEHPCQRPCSTG